MLIKCKWLIVAIVMLTFCSISTVSASGADGFLGVPWGSSREDVAKAMAARNFPKDVDSNAVRDLYVGAFADQRAYLGFYYVNNKLCEAGANFIDVNHYIREGGNYNAQVDACFINFEGLLIEKLGNPTNRYQDNNLPWKPCNAVWEIRDSDNSITVTLYKNHAYKDRDNDMNSAVFISYKNNSLYQREKKQSVNSDL